MSESYSIKAMHSKKQVYLWYNGSYSVRCRNKKKDWRLTYYEDVDLYTIQPIEDDRYLAAERSPYSGSYRKNSKGSSIILQEHQFFWVIQEMDVGEGYTIAPYTRFEKEKIKQYLKPASPNPMLSPYLAQWKLT
mmetsp:Transcript_13667/g.20703  ORF Transcript_13667/g.20703 Transcript_13667/m.20703 type:complete len:134 (-) Transcript_13667:663-1064(-)